MKRLFFLIVLFLIVNVCSVSCKKQDATLISRDLLQDLDTADLIWNSRFIDVGNSAFRPSLVEGWSPDRKELDGTTSGLASKFATTVFYVRTKSLKEMLVRCKTEPTAAKIQHLAVLVNGHRLRAYKVGPLYNEYRFRIQKKFQQLGENRLTFILSTWREQDSDQVGLSVDYITFAEDDQPRAEPKQLALHHKRSREFFRMQLRESAARSVVTVPSQSAIAFYEKIPSGAHLKVEYGLFKENSANGSAVRFTIHAEDEKKNRKILSSSKITRTFLLAPSQSKLIPLDVFENQVVRLSFEASPTGSSAPDRAYWAEASIVYQEQAHPQKRKDPLARQGRPNIIIYLIDALRADHLESYGYPKPTSPEMKKFAQDAVVFEKAYAQSSWTRPSVASILTGVYPSSHSAENTMDVFPGSIPTISSELKSNGYANLAFITNGNISKSFNFGSHFDLYEHLLEDGGRKEIHVQSDELFNRIKTFFARGFPFPTFLYIHATDPHEPYTPAPFSLNIPPDCPKDDPKIYRPSAKYGKSLYDKQTRTCITALYDSEILKSDFYFGKFIDLLKKNKMYENSIIILTADHGEQFLEHRALGHGASLYEPEIRIPLIIHLPNGQFSGTRIPKYARHIDIFPTILDFLSLKIPSSVQGETLLRLLEVRTHRNVPVFGELRRGVRDSQYLILGKYKLIRRLSNGPGYELFDLEADPGETVNLREKNPVRLGYMKMLLKMWMREQVKRKAALLNSQGVTVDDKLKEALRALGYIQ